MANSKAHTTRAVAGRLYGDMSMCVLEVDKPGQDGLTLMPVALGVTTKELRAKIDAQFTASLGPAAAWACI